VVVEFLQPSLVHRFVMQPVVVVEHMQTVVQVVLVVRVLKLEQP
jgi:hypothetical protein